MLVFPELGLNKSFTINGYTSYTEAEFWAEISKASGKDIKYVNLPAEVWCPSPIWHSILRS